MGSIGLIAAMPQERDALLRLVGKTERVRIGTYPAHAFEVDQQRCLLVTSGMGRKRAVQAARALVDHGSLDAVITYGIAGAVGTDLRIGDVVACETVHLLQQDILGPPVRMASLPHKAMEAVGRILAVRNASLSVGCAITTTGSQLVRADDRHLTNPVLEMETAGIVAELTGSGVPVFSLRAISDGPAAPIPIDLGRMMDENADLRIGRLLGEVVRHPGIILSSRRMLANTRIACDRAADAVVACLEWMDQNRI